MAFHDDLIKHAVFLANLNPPDQAKQVDLRRAVSAAYYALFHLLSNEAAQNWKHPRQRDKFARLFDHRRMRECSSQISKRPLPADPIQAPIAKDLKLVAASLVKLQQARHTADYDNSRAWSPTQVYELIIEAQDAMLAWMNIRDKEIAQDYLLDLLGAR